MSSKDLDKDGIDNNDDASEKNTNKQNKESKVNTGSKFAQKISDDAPLNLTKMYQDWFLDYASYVIFERVVPHLND